MKRRLKRFLYSGLLLLAAGLGFGPRVELDENIRNFRLPDDLDRYLTDQEQRIGDIRPGTEKVIVWSNPSERRPTDYSIVYLHGFSASRQEIAPVCDIVATELGANLYYTRLRGHGRDGDAMSELSVNTLLNDAVEALEIGKRLGRKVFIIGTSTGATLATWLAAYEKGDSIAGLVLLSPNYGPRRKESELLLLPWGRSMLQLIQGPEYRFEPHGELQKQYWTTRYPSQALLAMMGVVKLTRDKIPDNIRQPVLVMYAPDDQIVDSDIIRKMYSDFVSSDKDIVSVADSGDPQQHILAGDALSPKTTDRVAADIVEFIRRLSSPTTR